MRLDTSGRDVTDLPGLWDETDLELDEEEEEMSDVKEAAERLRSYSWAKINGPVLQPSIFQAFKDMHDVAEAYLASHRPDDDEPITEGFISEGHEEIDEPTRQVLIDDPLIQIDFFDGTLWLDIFNKDVMASLKLTITTNRQLRQLVELLGGAK